MTAKTAAVFASPVLELAAVRGKRAVVTSVFVGGSVPALRNTVLNGFALKIFIYHSVHKYRVDTRCQMNYVSFGMKPPKAPGVLGRPRAFCVKQALDRALRVFWHKGYEGASLSDLTSAMGINRPSLYAAYGNKENLFRKALERYAAGSGEFLRTACDLPTARAVVEHLLLAVADGVTCPDNPQGCLMVRGALASSEAADSVRLELARRRAEGEDLLRQRLERAKAEGDLPASAHPADLARFVTTLYQGMSVQAAGGATREQLRAVARTALAAWPA